MDSMCAITASKTSNDFNLNETNSYLNDLLISRYFIDDKSLKDHNKSKLHKKRVKQLKEVPYSQEEAERAAGMGSYDYKSSDNKSKKREKMETN